MWKPKDGCHTKLNYLIIRSKSSVLETAYFLLLLKILIIAAIAPIIVNNPTIIENIGYCPP